MFIIEVVGLDRMVLIGCLCVKLVEIKVLFLCMIIKGVVMFSLVRCVLVCEMSLLIILIN